MTEYKDVADYYFIADIFCHKCDYLAVKIANELTKADKEDEQSFFIVRKFSYVSRTKNAKVKFVEYLTKFVNNLLTVQRL